MNLFFRLLWTQLRARFRPACDIMGPCLTPFRCSLFDLDVLRHMNNGKYLSILDLARVDLMNRAGLSKGLNRHGFYPVIAGETIRFRRALKWRDRFVVETVVLGWDDKVFLVNHRFLRRGEVVAEAVVRARFLRVAGGTVHPLEIMKLAGVTQASPELPAWVDAWNRQQYLN